MQTVNIAPFLDLLQLKGLDLGSYVDIPKRSGIQVLEQQTEWYSTVKKKKAS
jgi:hypothetical protein